jgi:DNA polymerase III subunit epsilon
MRAEDLLALYRQMSTETLTIVDLETTGSKAENSRVIEISVLRANLQDGILWQETDLLNPGVSIPWFISNFTGITQKMVNAAPSSVSIWSKYQPWLSEGIFTAHNLGFDYSFVQAELRRLGTTFFRPSEQRLCTVQLSRYLLPELSSRSLPNLVQHFGFPITTAHRAADDTLACWMLAKHLLTRIQQDAEQDLLDRFSKQWISLQSAAAHLELESDVAWQQLDAAQAPWRFCRRQQTYLYPRGAVERLRQSNP